MARGRGGQPQGGGGGADKPRCDYDDVDVDDDDDFYTDFFADGEGGREKAPADPYARISHGAASASGGGHPTSALHDALGLDGASTSGRSDGPQGAVREGGTRTPERAGKPGTADGRSEETVQDLRSSPASRKILADIGAKATDVDRSEARGVKVGESPIFEAVRRSGGFDDLVVADEDGGEGDAGEE